MKLGYCSTWKADRRAISLLSLAEMAGMSTGIVTTTRVTHATPASAFAHSVDGDWESDAEKDKTAKDDASSCKDIGKSIKLFGNHLKLIGVIDPEGAWTRLK